MFEDEIPLGRAEDLKNQKFGKLTPIYRTINCGKATAWKCKCDCGKYVSVKAEHLKSGHTISCGCKTGKNYLNQKFGKLTIIKDDGTIKNKHIVTCQCECGNITQVQLSNLLNGNTTTCGNRNNHQIRSKWNNLIGQKFGKLTVIEETPRRVDGKIIWKCKCDCGNFTEVIGSNLIRGNTVSCGCVKSIGQETIIKLLIKKNIDFITEYSILNGQYRFDFYVNNSYLIEYDGIQHYISRGWQTKDRLEKTQEHDKFKNQWCKENNIPLIRIPYTKLDTLCIEDLMLETTQFRVV